MIAMATTGKSAKIQQGGLLCKSHCAHLFLAPVLQQGIRICLSITPCVLFALSHVLLHSHLQLSTPSTFLQAYVPPVYMPDDDDDEFDSVSSVHDSIESDSEDSDSDLELPDELKDTEEYRELVKLKNMRRLKLCSDGIVTHIGYKVCVCVCT